MGACMQKTMISIRYGLQKSFEKSHGIDIINDPRYKTANDVYFAAMVQIKREGLEEVKHKEVISEKDLETLYSSNVFSVNSPKTLLNKVFFEIILYFCNRGRENLRNMKKTDFVIHQDCDGRRFVASTVARLSKNHQGQNLGDDDQNGGRMYEQPESPNCPVLSFEKYIAKLNGDCEALWQRPKSSVDDSSSTWYDNMVLGKNTLGSMMQKISEVAGLSCVYSNHCIRATCITMLDQSGYESRHIIGISKHRSESSLKHYSTKLSVTKKRSMSDALAKKLAPVTVNREALKSITNVQTHVPASTATDQSHVLSDIVDVNDEELALLLDNPMFGNLQDTGISIPNVNSTKSIFSFHGCNVTINN